jgi:hypothetical protein
VPVALAVAVATLPVLAAQASPGEAAAISRPAPIPLPRSSIAAVLAQGGTLGLTAEQVKELEKRDAALQKEQASIREKYAPPEGGTERSPVSFAGPGGGAPPGSGPAAPAAGAVPGGGGPGGRGKPPPAKRPKAEDPSSRAARMTQELDDADTHAWLEVAARLPPALEEKATAVAARYREQLAAVREAAPGDSRPSP